MISHSHSSTLRGGTAKSVVPALAIYTRPIMVDVNSLLRYEDMEMEVDDDGISVKSL